MIRPAVRPCEVRDPYAMQNVHFEQIRKMVYSFCGVDLRGKQILVGTRLAKSVRELGLESFDSFCEQVSQNIGGPLFSSMIDALTTNHTSFFREQQHFDFLRKTVLPEIGKNATISIWSAACSSGEEPYTIAFTLIDALGVDAFSRTRILASDVSTRVLDQAQRGLYPVERIAGVPQNILRSCLLQGTGQYAEYCLVKPEVRKLIEFRRINLLEEASSFGPFQVIFCRNVMIYFDRETQQNVVQRLTSRLAPGGYLLIGHSESLNGIEHSLEYVCPATYRKPAGGSKLLSRSGLRGRPTA